MKDVDLEKVGVAAAGGVLGTKVQKKLKIDSDNAKKTIVQKTTAAKNKINSKPVQKAYKGCVRLCKSPSLSS